MFSFNSYTPSVTMIDEVSVLKTTEMINALIPGFCPVYPNEGVEFLTGQIGGQETSDLEKRLMTVINLDMADTNAVAIFYDKLDLLRAVYRDPIGIKYVKRQLTSQEASEWRKSLERKIYVYGNLPTASQLEELSKNLDAIQAVFS